MSMSEPVLGQVSLFAGGFSPWGWLPCDGRLLPIAQYDAVYALLGTNFGGDGVTTFALPDTRISQDNQVQGALGQPAWGNPSAGAYHIAVEGIFPPGSSGDTYLGETLLLAHNVIPTGFLACDGAILSIAQNQALFSLLGTMYGGDGVTTFGLPDLRSAGNVGSVNFEMQPLRYCICATSGIYPPRP